MALKQLVELGGRLGQVRPSCLGVDMRDLKVHNNNHILLLERIVGIETRRRRAGMQGAIAYVRSADGQTLGADCQH
jgi:hypothetical protein